MNDEILRVRNLAVAFDSRDGPIQAVDRVNFAARRGRITAVVGESGCGKSITAMSIARLLPPTASCRGEIHFDGAELLSLSDRTFQSYRGRRIAMIFQEPMTALNPVLRIGDQLCDAIIHHFKLSRRDAEARAVSQLAHVALPDPQAMMARYPHELSGGMRQRVMIAIALALEPQLIIADEPTTALDVTVQNQILHLLRALCRDHGVTVLVITHDWGVVSAVADDVVVMYAGRVVETGAAGEVMRAPLHPYTRGLMRCIPRLGEKRGRLEIVPGAVPEPREMPSGCRFHPRCADANGNSRCESEDQSLVAIDTQRSAACWRASEPQSKSQG